MIIFRLKEIMEQRNISGYALAKMTGIRPNTISDWCADEGAAVRSITVDTLDKICSALNCNISDILEHIPED